MRKYPPPCSSSSSLRFPILMALLWLLASGNCGAVSTAHEAELAAQLCIHYLHHRHGKFEESSTTPFRHMPAWCPNSSSSQAPPPLPGAGGVDPGNGAEKRLVPTGPNPLHN